MDIITLSLAKKYANKVAAGYSSVKVDGMNLIFTLNDGSEVTMAIPAPADGKDGADGAAGKDGLSVQNLSIDDDGSLLCHMSDGSVIDAGKVPTVETEQVQSDWNQNDSTQPDYVKNRICYSEGITTNEVVILERASRLFDIDDSEMQIFDYTFTDGEKGILESLNGKSGILRFTIEDRIYEQQTVINEDMVVRIYEQVGNNRYDNYGINYGTIDTQFIRTNDISLTFITTEENIVKLPEKYLPETIATKEYVDEAAAGAGSLPVIAATDETNPVNLSDYAENGTAYIVKGHFFTPNTRNSMLGEWADWFLLINADAPNGDVYQTLRPFSTVFLNGDYVLNSKIAFKLASEDDWKTRDIFTEEYDDPTALGGFSPAGAYTMYNDITNQMNTYVINPSDEAYTTFFTEGEEEFNFINEEIGNDFTVQLAGVLQTIYDKYTSNEYGILLYLDNQPVWFKATDLWDEPESLTLANTYIYNGENGPIIKEVELFITLVWEDGYITQIGVGTGHNYIKVASEDLLNEKLGDIDTVVTQIVESILDAEGKEY